MRQMVRTSFKAQMHVEDDEQIRKLKMQAIQGIQNYVIHESTRCAPSARSPFRSRCQLMPAAVSCCLLLLLVLIIVGAKAATSAVSESALSDPHSAERASKAGEQWKPEAEGTRSRRSLRLDALVRWQLWCALRFSTFAASILLYESALLNGVERLRWSPMRARRQEDLRLRQI